MKLIFQLLLSSIQSFSKLHQIKILQKQEVVDGTTVTITNTMLNGTLTLQLIRTSGIVARGDAIACFKLIKATGDNGWNYCYRIY